MGASVSLSLSIILAPVRPPARPRRVRGAPADPDSSMIHSTVRPSLIFRPDTDTFFRPSLDPDEDEGGGRAGPKGCAPAGESSYRALSDNIRAI